MFTAYGFIKIARLANLNEMEASAAVEILSHYAEYVGDIHTHLDNDTSLSTFVLSGLISDGKIAGHSFLGSTLELYSPSLASALRKLEQQLPRRKSNPLAAAV